MTRSQRLQRALPAGVLAVVTVTDVVSGPDQVILGLMVMAPLLAATTLSRRGTVGYAVLALVLAALLGVYDQQYTASTMLPQVVRLLAVAGGGVLAVGACSLRLRREAQLARLSAQAATTEAALRTAEALQLNLLGPPPRVAGLESAVRYLPASRHTQVGGDWYDAFSLPDGSTMLVIGDVAGHDAPAAATMAQVRAMLQAIAQRSPGSPAAVLSALDEVLAGLGLQTLVTVTAARIDARAQDAVYGTRLLRWSNAGHPPLLLARADGGVVLLDRTPESLLGIAPGAPRTDHTVRLCPGDTLLFYTDGLIERRGAPLDDGLAWLVGELSRTGREPLDRLCDDLLGQLGGRVDDDVALLAVRVPG
ncbi:MULTISPECIES: PP2C family protein-serine/threonine phosphatase [unclassified Modestobacter]|uniref:PP2C family protein-serine/threonine phosphatase n=1 Tax=unclassified Modestobacter TaxID=2643866 RepID=UPI0022AAAFD0|nr:MULTISPECIES: PP2C family protein-serine/threonine phosphatase [unclassified Modestobacter]MCZ2822781.1 PP2C family protein-serine/threonine phosphatase [Modestobacter sp. VKM Ac-2981]MCZ2851027.1 PP2C family protein-serine/threonine phosphatase [Modestobacter sp. VKM Ac-2982]